MGREIETEELRCLQIGCLDAVADYCDKYNLRYYLAYGTLLGAVRHKGYIPWDDDIDIVMPRPDYEYIIEHFNKEKSFFLLTHSSIDENYPISYAKVYDDRTIVIEKVNAKYKLGVNIDIFPIDGLPDDQTTLVKHLTKIKKLRSYLIIKLCDYSKVIWYKRFLLLFYQNILSLYSFQDLCGRIDLQAKKYDFNTSKYVTCSVYPERLDERMNKEKVYSSTKKLLFEGKEYCVPSGYDEFLKEIYGDYMKLPPIEQRVTHHSFSVYWK